MAMRKDGASWVKIAQEKKMNESTVRSIYAKKEDIRAKGKNSELEYSLKKSFVL